MAVVFGPIAGGLIGLIGHALQDAISYGSVWWSWVIVSALIGLFIGLFAQIAKINVESGEFGRKEIISFNIVQVIINIIGWVGVAPLLDKVIFAEPYSKAITQGVAAGISNIITVGILGTLLIVAYARTRSQTDSLSKE